MSDLLRVENLRTWFPSERGPIRAVDGVDFEIGAGRTLGVVGESGSGKSVTALSIMRLVQAPGEIRPSSRILFDGRDLVTASDSQMEEIRGNDISMIFQEPMTSLNPVYSVGDQIAEAVRSHRGVGRKEALERALEMLRARRHPRGGAPRQGLPASALGRDAPARDDRHGARLRSEAAHRRRADDGARRDDPGADPRADGGACRSGSGCRSCSSRTTSASSPRCATTSSSCTPARWSSAAPWHRSSARRSTRTPRRCCSRSRRSA